MSSIPFFYFFFSSRTFQQHFICSSIPQTKKKKKKICSSHQRKERDGDKERGERLGEIGLGLHRHSSISTTACRPPHQSAWVRSAPPLFFFFSYLLILIQLYFKNWILFCVLCFVFGLILFLMNKSLSFLFFLFFFFYFFDFIWFMRKKETTATERMRIKKKKKKKRRRRSHRENERKKRNLEEREIIDKISSCSNILMQEIRLLMYSSSSHLMSYCSLEKKKKRF